MIGFILAIVLVLFRFSAETVLLGLIGGALLDITYELSWTRKRQQCKDKMMSDMLKEIGKELRKEVGDGRDDGEGDAGSG